MGTLATIIATDPRAARMAATTLKTKGKGSDTELAHLNPRELVQLRRISGRAPDGSDDDINPATGLPMFDDDSGEGDGGPSGGGNTSSAGENTGGSNPGGTDTNTGGGPSGRGDGGNEGYGGRGITDMGNVGFSPGNSPTGFSSPNSINESEASSASRAGSSMADNYAGMGPDRANAYGLGWNEYSEQTTGLTGALNSLAGIGVKGPTATNPNASWGYDVSPTGIIGGFIGGPIGMLAGKALSALGMPDSVQVAGGGYKSEIGGNVAPTGTEMADAIGGIGMGGGAPGAPGGGSPAGASTGGNGDPYAGSGGTRTAGADPTQTGGKEGPGTTPLAASERPDRSIEAKKYIDSLRSQWGFQHMEGRRPSILNTVVADAGRNGDTEVAHLSPAIQRFLKAQGGAGSVNPVTGAREFFTSADAAAARYAELAGGVLGGNVGGTKFGHNELIWDGKKFITSVKHKNGNPANLVNQGNSVATALNALVNEYGLTPQGLAAGGSAGSVRYDPGAGVVRDGRQTYEDIYNRLFKAAYDAKLPTYNPAPPPPPPAPAPPPPPPPTITTPTIAPPPIPQPVIQQPVAPPPAVAVPAPTPAPAQQQPDPTPNPPPLPTPVAPQKFYGADWKEKINDTYKSILGRDAENEGKNNWYEAMANWNEAGKDPYSTLQSHIKNSDESQNKTIGQTYRDLLGREGEQSGVEHWNKTMDNWLAEGKDPWSNLTESFRGTDEFKAKKLADTTPLQMVSSLTPVRTPRNRSQRYQGFTPTTAIG